MDYSWVERAADKIAAGGMDVRLGGRPKPDNDGKFGRIEAIDLKTKQVVWSTDVLLRLWHFRQLPRRGDLERAVHHAWVFRPSGKLSPRSSCLLA